MVNIQLAAKILKANPDKKYKIAGYADKATGSAKWNQKLSEARAQAVYDALIKEGVSKINWNSSVWWNSQHVWQELPEPCCNFRIIGFRFPIGRESFWPIL